MIKIGLGKEKRNFILILNKYIYNKALKQVLTSYQ